jgi:hypothetical protein
MARVKICTSCGHRNHESAFGCEKCCNILPDAEHISVREESIIDDSGEKTTIDREMSFCYSLEFQWGAVEIRDSINIGRDSDFSPVSAHMNE